MLYLDLADLLRRRRHAFLGVALAHPHLERVELNVCQHVAACICWRTRSTGGGTSGEGWRQCTAAGARCERRSLRAQSQSKGKAARRPRKWARVLAANRETRRGAAEIHARRMLFHVRSLSATHEKGTHPSAHNHNGGTPAASRGQWRQHTSAQRGWARQTHLCAPAGPRRAAPPCPPARAGGSKRERATVRSGRWAQGRAGAVAARLTINRQFL